VLTWLSPVTDRFLSKVRLCIDALGAALERGEISAEDYDDALTQVMERCAAAMDGRTP